LNHEDTIIAYIWHVLYKEEGDVGLSATDNLIEGSPIDSMGVVQLVAFLEQQFQVSIRPGEVTLKNFKTASAMLALIEKKQAQV